MTKSKTSDEAIKNLQLSVSSIDTFKSCKAKWYYRYVEKLPVADNYYSTTGKFIHKILEIFLRRYKRNGGDLRNAASVAYRLAQRDEEIRPSLTKEIRDEGKAWIISLTKKYEQNPDLIPDALKIEASFSFKIEEANITVRGYIDRVDLVDSDNICIVDYKTSKSADYLKPFQLHTYAYAMRDKYPGKSINGAYELVRYDFNRLTVEIKEQDYDNVIETFKSVGSEIRTLQDKYPNKVWEPTITKLCGYCPFRRRCEEDRSSSPWQV